jgi:hypothetical protein
MESAWLGGAYLTVAAAEMQSRRVAPRHLRFSTVITAEAGPVNTSEALTTIAQVAVTLLGFTGVVAVLGRRAHGDWTGHEIATFKTLLEASATALFVSFLPGLLAMATESDLAPWRIANAVLGFVHLGFFLAFFWRIREFSARPTLAQKLLAPTAPLLILAHFLTAVGAIAGAELILLLGLLQQLFVGVMTFVILLVHAMPKAEGA